MFWRDAARDDPVKEGTLPLKEGALNEGMLLLNMLRKEELAVEAGLAGGFAAGATAAAPNVTAALARGASGGAAAGTFF